MNVDRIMVYEHPEGKFGSLSEPLHIEVSIPGKNPAWFTADNIYCLENWQRETDDFEPLDEELALFGSFATLQALREAHTEAAKDTQEIDEMAHLNMISIPTASPTEHTPYDQEKALWFIFVAETASEILPKLVDWYELCRSAPFTVSYDPVEEFIDLEDNCMSYLFHEPRVKLSIESIRMHIKVILDDCDNYGTDWPEGGQIFDSVTIERARNIIAAQEARHQEGNAK